MFAPARRGWDGKEKDTLTNIRNTNQFSSILSRPPTNSNNTIEINRNDYNPFLTAIYPKANFSFTNDENSVFFFNVIISPFMGHE